VTLSADRGLVQFGRAELGQPPDPQNLY